MRLIEKINTNWLFQKEDQTKKVKLPHTWNGLDGQDGGNDYYRGTCSYKRLLKKPEIQEGDQVYLEFRGVNSSAAIYVNGCLCGEHDGGYSTFRVNITKALQEENELMVKADNSPNRTVYPQKADFTFYGGIYRDVYLIVVPETHFDLDYYGSQGIQVTPKIQGDDALVTIEVYYVGCPDKIYASVMGVGSVLCEADGNKAVATICIPKVRLWKGRKDPYLYSATAYLYKDGEMVDQVHATFGCRSYFFDKEKGFFLNGESLPLRGVSKHQDWKDVGNAITPEMMRRDMDLIEEMGANTIRLAHYQHDQYFYDLCDQKGMIVWAEIPYISEHMPEAKENTVSQLTELIVQNYNHPSIICWGLSNEITVINNSDDLKENHKKLNDLAHKLDDTRATTMAHVIMLDINDSIMDIPDIHSYNLYFGWYFGELEDNEKWFDKFHATHPEKVIGLSEYGADASMKYQSPNAERGDYSEQYQCLYHEHLIRVIEERPYIWATHVWNMFDFGADGREEGGEKGLNQKGLVSFDRTMKKDAFYLYKAYFSDEPFVHVCGRRYTDRVEGMTEIKIYSNQKEIALYDNDTLVGKKTGRHIFVFKLPISGLHKIRAVSGNLYDEIEIQKVTEKKTAYTLPSSGIHNWFDEPGMEFPPGYLSIKDTLGTIRKNTEGAEIVNRLIVQASKKRGDVAQGLERNEAMQQMLNKMTLEAIIKQAGDAIPKETVILLNQALNKLERC